MFFTQDDYKKIQQWLIKNSVKDTEFSEANIPFNGEETITIVQGNQNKKVFLKDLIAQVFNLGISDFVNITDKYDAPNISLEEAIRLIPSRARKEGQVITFLNKEDGWNIYQFKGVLNQWNVLDTWEDLFDWEKLIIDSILPDEEDLTKSEPDTNGNSYLSLKDREYNPEDFSGLGRVILRKNIVEIEDPIYGKVKKNILYQDMFTQSNTIYEIRYDFDLNGAEITIPEGCVLDFQGGSLSNGTIVGNNTFIKASPYNIFGLDTVLDGSFTNEYADIRWFGAVSDLDYKNKTGTDVSPYILKAIELTNKNNGMYIKIVGRYYLSTPIVTPAFVHLVGGSYENIFTMSRANNPEFVYNNPPSFIFVKKGITAFTLIGTGNTDTSYPKATSFTFEKLRLESECCNSTFADDGIYNQSSESILITHTATGNPSRFPSINNCFIDGFDKAINIIPADKFYKWGTLLSNFTIDKVFLCKNNAFGIYIDGSNDYEGAANSRIDTVTALHISNSKIMCNLHIYDLYGASMFSCVTFEGRKNQLDFFIRDAAVIFQSCYFEYQTLECVNKFRTLNFRGLYSFEGCYNTANNTNLTFYFEDCEIGNYDFNSDIEPQIVISGRISMSGSIIDNTKCDNLTFLKTQKANNTYCLPDTLIVTGIQYKENVVGGNLNYKEFTSVGNKGNINYDTYLSFYKSYGSCKFKVGDDIISIPYSKGYYLCKLPTKGNSREIFIQSNIFMSNISIRYDYPEFESKVRYLYATADYISSYASDIENKSKSIGQRYLHIPSNTERFYNGEKWMNQDGTFCDRVHIATNYNSLKNRNINNAIVIIIDDIDCNGEEINLGTDNTIMFNGGSIKNAVCLGTRLFFNNELNYTDNFIDCDLNFTIKKGQYKFDKDLNKPIWWTGSKWVDATGANV